MLAESQARIGSHLPVRKSSRLVIVVGVVPYSRRGASSVIFHAYIMGLKKAGFEILAVLLLSPASTEEDLAEYRAEMEAPGFRIITCRSSHFWRTTRLGHFFDRQAVESLRSEVEGFRPDCTLCLDFASAWAVEGWHLGRRIAWLGDLNFQTFWYHAVYAKAEGVVGLGGLMLGAWYAYLWKRLYTRVLRSFDGVVVSAKSSEKEMAKIGICASYIPYPYPAEVSSAPMKRAAKPTFFFFGHLQGLGSRSAFHVMEAGIYPKLRALWGDGGFEILIGGSGGLPDWVKTAIAQKPEFRYLGFVEDLDAVLAQCHAVIAPIDVPVGNRTRILTALAKRVLIVAHSNTALGNPDLVDGSTCYLAGDVEGYVSRLRAAVEDLAMADTIAQRGQDAYRAHFLPNVAVPAIAELLDPGSSHKRS